MKSQTGVVRVVAMSFVIGIFGLLGCNSPTTYVRPNVLDRLAWDPASPYHADYVEYKKGQIDEAKLIDRLPHIALVGDSLSRDFYAASVLDSLWRAKSNHMRDWFLDTDPSPDSVYSLFERLEQITPLVATEYASVGATVGPGKKLVHLLGFLAPLNLSDQVSQILDEKRFPDLLLLWIGHNNMDWAKGLTEAQIKTPDDYLHAQSAIFRRHYTEQLTRLIDRAKTENHKCAIVVYGLVNFVAYFNARAAAEELKQANPDLYPYLEVDYNYYLSLRPEYRGNMIRLSYLLDIQLKEMVDDFNKNLKDCPNVHLVYSDAFCEADLSPVASIHPMDAWHPSVKGHSVLAEAALKGLGPSLQFLGWRAK